MKLANIQKTNDIVAHQIEIAKGEIRLTAILDVLKNAYRGQRFVAARHDRASCPQNLSSLHRLRRDGGWVADLYADSPLHHLGPLLGLPDVWATPDARSSTMRKLWAE